MKYLICVLLILIPLASNAEIYKTVDKYGNVSYTDKPVNNNSVPIEAPTVNSVPSTSSAASQTGNPNPENTIENKSTRKPYTKFLIISPNDQETIQNQPTIPIKIEVEPFLQDGDVIQIYLDGAPWGNSLPTTTFQLPAPDRGTHIISATLFDKDMNVLNQSNSNTIFVHHTHL